MSYCAAAQDTRGVKVVNTQHKQAVTGETYAIIIGISNYPGLNPLKYADKDALLFRDFLYTPAGGNVKKENVFCLINDSAKAASFNVKAYSWLKRKSLKEGDRLFLYFSGHGDAMNEDNYFFLPFDCTPYNVDNNYLGTGNINMHTVKTLFIKPLAAKGVDVLLIVDACRTNELPGGESGQQNFNTYIQSNVTEQKQGEIIMLSTSAGNVSLESPKIGNGHGLFTWYLIDGLSGAADKEGDAADHDGVVSLAEIASWVKNKVRKEAKEIFHTVQSPVFLPQEKENESIAVVDSSTYLNWVATKNMAGKDNLYAFENGKKGKTGGEKGVSASVIDTALIKLYNRFVEAIKTGNLSGQKSAETFYYAMVKTWPDNSLTDDAKYTLATEFINFGQQKINLFLSGKSLIHIQRMEEGLKRHTDATKNKADILSREGKSNKGSKDSLMFPAAGEELRKMKVIATTNFDTAAVRMQKAVELLKTEPELLASVYPKLYFLKAAALRNSATVSKLKEGVAYCRKAIASDSTGAYNYLMMAWLMADLNLDSAAYFYKKTIKLAPKWAYPVNGFGIYLDNRKMPQLALSCYKKAIALDTLFSNAYQNIATIYYEQENADSAKYYFKKAIKIDTANAYAYSNLGRLYSDSIRRDTAYFKTAKFYFQKAISSDSKLIFPYNNLAGLYLNYLDDDKGSTDSARKVLKLCILKNPGNAEAFTNLGYFYLSSKRDTLSAENYYKKALEIDPFQINNYNALAKFYADVDFKEKAIGVYEAAIKVDPKNPAVYNEMGNFYLDRHDDSPKDTIIARRFYKKALLLDPKLAYVNYNTGRTFFRGIYWWWPSGISRSDIIDSAIYYFERAVKDTSYYFLNQSIAYLYLAKSDNSKAAFYYEQCLKLNQDNYSRNLESLVDVLFLDKKFEEAKALINKYAANDELLFNKLMGFVNATNSKVSEANLNFVRSMGFNDEDAKAYLNVTRFPYILQSHFPDREGLKSNLYLQFVNKNPELISPQYIANIRLDTNYYIPYFKVLSLFDYDVSKFFSVRPDEEYLKKIVKLTYASKKTKYPYLAIVLAQLDVFQSQMSNHLVTKKFTYSNIWPISHKWATVVSIIPKRNTRAIADSLKAALKTDPLNTRLNITIGDIYLQIAQDDATDLNNINIENKAQWNKKDSTLLNSDFKQAIFYYKNAINIDPKFGVVAYCRLGDFYSQSLQFDLAEKFYRKSIRDDSTFVYPYMKLAEHYYKNKSNQDSTLYYLKKSAMLDSAFKTPLKLAQYELSGYPDGCEFFLKKAVAEGFEQAYWPLFKYYNYRNDQKNSLLSLENCIQHFWELGESGVVQQKFDELEKNKSYADLIKLPAYLFMKKRFSIWARERYYLEAR